MMRLLQLAWNGKLSLAKAYWQVYFLNSMLLSIIIFAVFGMSLSTETTVKDHDYYSALAHTLSLPYIIFSAICVWRCSRSAAFIWKYLSLVTILLAFVAVFFDIKLLITRII